MLEENHAASGPSLAIWAKPDVQNDLIFDRGDTHTSGSYYQWVLNNNNSFYEWAAKLRDALKAKGWRCHTHDIFQQSGEIPDVVVLNEVPRVPLRRFLGPWVGRSRVIVILWEAPVVRALNWRQDLHRDFDILFTWDPNLIDGQRYRMMPAAPRPFDSSFSVERDLSLKTGFCTLIATNQHRHHPLELYSARREAIRWFEQHHPESFDLYGVGWNEHGFRGHQRVRHLGLMRILTRLIPPEPRPSYRGQIAFKHPVLQRYRFAICFENARDTPGYVTEKIFDALTASCVPIYWGAPDIAQYVPEDCFVDFRRFMDYAKLYEFLKSMSDATYLGYLDRIENFMRRQHSGPYSCGSAVDALVAAVTELKPRTNRQ